MAISKFLTDYNTVDLTTFYNWLEANKAGTFLQNKTITLTSASSSGSTLTIASTNSVLTFNPKRSAGSDWDVLSLNGTYGTWSLNFGSTTSGRILSLMGAVMCSKGLLIMCGVITATSTTPYSLNYFLITEDSTGEICLVYPNKFVQSSDDTVQGYKVAAYESTSTPLVTLIPQWDSTLTSIAPVVPTAGDNEITFPYAYAAIHTQQHGRGLAAVTINNNNYITDGVLYVKDGD